MHYWVALRSDAAEFARILSEKVEFSAWVGQHLEELEGDRIEIGIGPLGIGCIQLLPGAEDRCLVGVDPLPFIPSGELSLPETLRRCAEEYRSLLDSYVQAPGEATGLLTSGFSFAACYNVLDHVRDPQAVLIEVNRLLVADGVLALSCDVTSMLSDLRYRLWVRPRYRNTIGVRAHPFRFKERQLRRLLERAGFEPVTSRGGVRMTASLVGRAARPGFLYRKAREVRR